MGLRQQREPDDHLASVPVNLADDMQSFKHQSRGLFELKEIALVGLMRRICRILLVRYLRFGGRGATWDFRSSHALHTITISLRILVGKMQTA